MTHGVYKLFAIWPMGICVQLEYVFKAFGTIILQRKFLLKNLKHRFKIFCFQNSFQLVFYVSLTLRYCIALRYCILTSCITTVSKQKSCQFTQLIVFQLLEKLNSFSCICDQANLMLVKYLSGILTTHQNCIQYSCKFYFLQVRR